MDLDPFTLLVFLNLDFQRLKPLEASHLVHKLFEWLLAAFPEDSRDDGFRNFARSPPNSTNHNKHDQVEQCQLQYDKQHIQEQNQDHSETGPQQECQQ